MENTMTAGARCFPQFGPLAVHGGVWSERVRTAPAIAPRLRTGSSFYRAFNVAQVSPIGIDLPVTDRMRVSASEP